MGKWLWREKVRLRANNFPTGDGGKKDRGVIKALFGRR